MSLVGRKPRGNGPGVGGVGGSAHGRPIPPRLSTSRLHEGIAQAWQASVSSEASDGQREEQASAGAHLGELARGFFWSEQVKRFRRDGELGPR